MGISAFQRGPTSAGHSADVRARLSIHLVYLPAGSPPITASSEARSSAHAAQPGLADRRGGALCASTRGNRHGERLYQRRDRRGGSEAVRAVLYVVATNPRRWWRPNPPTIRPGGDANLPGLP